MAQANLCILPKEYAYDFLLFCMRNPKPCPLLHVLEAGQHTFDGIDVRSDLPLYRHYIDGALQQEPALTDISHLWEDDFVTFVIGCSFSFEEALSRAGLPLRHVEEKKNVPMYNTNMQCESAGVFSGNVVVSMRPMLPAEAIRAIEVTARFPRVHGSPIHIGEPSLIGISSLSQPDFGEAVTVREGEVPVFWACGVTPQAVVMKCKPRLCITHSPGCMLVLDAKNDQLST